MSSIIAVSVSLLGLSAVIFTLAIFVELIISFPAMLSSNSRAYVQQQRKIYSVSGAHETRRRGLSDDTEWELEDDEVAERWIDEDDEEDDKGTARGWRRDEPVTRGRTLKRQARGHSARTGLRV